MASATAVVVPGEATEPTFGGRERAALPSADRGALGFKNNLKEQLERLRASQGARGGGGERGCPFVLATLVSENGAELKRKYGGGAGNREQRQNPAEVKRVSLYWMAPPSIPIADREALGMLSMTRLFASRSFSSAGVLYNSDNRSTYGLHRSLSMRHRRVMCS